MYSLVRLAIGWPPVTGVPHSALAALCMDDDWVLMRREADPSAELEWLVGSAGREEVTGYDLDGWADSTWVLHAMYENPVLRDLGTHDEWRQRQLRAGVVGPVVIGDVNLDEATTVTGIGLGYVLRPGKEWRRLSWHEYLERTGAPGPSSGVPPCFRWFPPGSWPLAIEPAPEGSLDEESFAALVEVLSHVASDGARTECVAYFCPLAAKDDFDHPHVWRGPLHAVPDLLEDNGGPYGSTPTNLWPADRSWFLWTDWDLEGTKVSGAHEVVAAVRADAVLETIDWLAGLA